MPRGVDRLKQFYGITPAGFTPDEIADLIGAVLTFGSMIFAGEIAIQANSGVGSIANEQLERAIRPFVEQVALVLKAQDRKN